MKWQSKTIISILVVAVFLVNILACGEKAKYNLNANNGLMVITNSKAQSQLVGITDNKIFTIQLDSGDKKTTNISTSLDGNSIIGLEWRLEGCFFIKDKRNEIWGKDFESGEEALLWTLPNKNYKSICFVGRTNDYIATLSGKTLTLYGQKDFELNNKNVEYSLDKEYSSMFYFGDNTIGLINKNQIDFMQLEAGVRKNFPRVDFDSITKYIVLDKQYDAYIGCYIDYDDMMEERTLCLGCIENNKIKFYNLKRGQFEKNPFNGEEYSWTF